MFNLVQSKMNYFSYADWNRYFVKNAHFLVIPFENDILTEREKKLVFPSIGQFQQGEYSDGKHLKKAADRFAEETKNKDYKNCIRWFIR